MSMMSVMRVVINTTCESIEVNFWHISVIIQISMKKFQCIALEKQVNWQRIKGRVQVV